MGLTVESSAQAKLGLTGATAEYQASVEGGVGFGIEGAKTKVSARADLADATAKFGKGQEINAKLGVNVDTGFEAEADTVAASVAGFGASIGRTIGVKTPVGELNFKLW